MAESKFAVIVPLQGSNYPTWKLQCQMTLMKENLWGSVNGSETAPADGADRIAKFNARKDKALATIILSIDPTLLYLVGEPKDPVDVWKLLSNNFQKKTWANRLALRRKLHSLQLKEGQSVCNHIKCMTELFNELTVVGDNISDEDRVVYLLASLPESFDMLVTALEANKDVPKMETVIERLQHEEMKKNERGSIENTEEAMTVKHKPHRKGPKCHYCHKYGYIQRFCKEREKAAQSTNPKDNSTVNKHHRTTSSVKTSHKVNSASVKKRSDSELDSDEAGLVVKHALSVLETTHESQWIIDSGATSHMCTDQRMFTELHPLSKSLEVKLGDGHVLTAVGQGTVQLIMKCGRDKYRKCTLSDVLYVPKLSCNLLSVSKTTEKGNDVKFYEDTCIIRDVN